MIAGECISQPSTDRETAPRMARSEEPDAVESEWNRYLAEVRLGEAMNRARIARIAAKAAGPVLAGEGQVATRGAPEGGRSHEGPGQSREETPKEGTPREGLRTGGKARVREDGHYSRSSRTGAISAKTPNAMKQSSPTMMSPIMLRPSPGTAATSAARA